MEEFTQEELTKLSELCKIAMKEIQTKLIEEFKKLDGQTSEPLPPTEE